MRLGEFVRKSQTTILKISLFDGTRVHCHRVTSAYCRTLEQRKQQYDRTMKIITKRASHKHKNQSFLHIIRQMSANLNNNYITCYIALEA